MLIDPEIYNEIREADENKLSVSLNLKEVN